MLESVRIARAGKTVGGRKIGEVEEGYLEQLTPGDTFLFAGQVWRFEGVTGIDALVTPAPDKDPKMPSPGAGRSSRSPPTWPSGCGG